MVMAYFLIRLIECCSAYFLIDSRAICVYCGDSR
jgi:hypothetical protein